ncbi:hypothetical protein [Rhizobium chutanense]|uniref:Uncharacterized protein n=1 Tax=Rhizobium chutanense TaxID=2035448 RepID=A0A432NSL4_9HYPH|nr:hypothetical protein [Rhizobium chutanense]RUM02657.1 hypothetical protein EFR84_19950 [Rhizobium chutanense]
MQVFIGIAYLVIGLVQLGAIAAGIEYGAGIGGILSFIIATFLTYIPLIGSFLGVYGAYHEWHWGLWQSAALFFWYVPVVILMGGLSALTSRR